MRNNSGGCAGGGVFRVSIRVSERDEVIVDENRNLNVENQTM